MLKTAAWLALVVVLALAAWSSLGGGASDTSAAASDRPAGLTAVVERRDIESTVLATGVLRPEDGAEVRVGSRASGVLLELHATVGDTVDRGALLAVLDATELEARRAEVAADLAGARVDLRFAAKDLARARELLAAQVIAPAEFETVERTEAVARARVARLEAALASANVQLGYTRIVAPIAGVVADVATQVGETVAASFAAPTFVTIIDLDRLEVWAYVDETDIGRVHVSQQASFTVDTYPDHEFEGTVTAVRSRAEIVDNVVNYVAEIAIAPGHGRTLRPEMTARVNIVTEGRRGVLAVPSSAVRRDREGTYALVSGADGPARRSIRTGVRGDDLTEVRDGLAAGDTVLLGPLAGSNTLPEARR
jgi:macrolide-specific efflux system membrane fusion protein